MVVGGKPILAWPAFMVIGFEVTVLVGGSVTHALLAFTTLTGRSRNRMPVTDSRFSVDRIGIYVLGNPARATAVFETQGAEEVHNVD